MDKQEKRLRAWMAKNPDLTRRQCIEQMKARAAELHTKYPQKVLRAPFTAEQLVEALEELASRDDGSVTTGVVETSVQCLLRIDVKRVAPLSMVSNDSLTWNVDVRRSRLALTVSLPDYERGGHETAAGWANWFGSKHGCVVRVEAERGDDLDLVVQVPRQLPSSRIDQHGEPKTMRAAGVAGPPVNLLHSFEWQDDPSFKFSQPCPDCGRWILCTKHLADGTCFCGKAFRVVFGAPDWSLAKGARCMDCGAVDRMTEPHEGRNPWRILNSFQRICRACQLFKEKVGEHRALYDYMNTDTNRLLDSWESGYFGPLVKPLVAEARLKQAELHELREAIVAEMEATGDDADSSEVTSVLAELETIMKSINNAASSAVEKERVSFSRTGT